MRSRLPRFVAAMSVVGVLAAPASATAAPDLVSSLTPAGARAPLGGSLTFNGSVSNVGDAPATTVVIAFSWSPRSLGRAPSISGTAAGGCGAPADDGSGDYRLDCSYPSVAAGAAGQVSLRFTHLPAAGSGAVSLNARTETPEQGGANNDATAGFTVVAPATSVGPSLPPGTVSARRYLFGGLAGESSNLDRNHDGRLNIRREAEYVLRYRSNDGSVHRIRFYYQKLLPKIDGAPGSRRDGFVTRAEMDRWVARHFDRNHDALLSTAERGRLRNYTDPYIESRPLD